MLNLLEVGSDPMLGRKRGSSKINDDAMSANVRQLRPGQEGSSSLKDPPTPLVDKLTAVALAPMGAGNPPGNPASRSPAGARPAATLLSNWVRWPVFLKLCGAAEILSKTLSLVFYIAQNCFSGLQKTFR